MYVFKRQMLISWNIVLRSVSKTGRFDVLQRAKHLPEFVLYKSSSRGIKKPLKSLFPSSTWYLSLVNSFLGVTKIFTVGGIAVVNFKKKKKKKSKKPNPLPPLYYYFHLIVPKIFQSGPSPRVLLEEKKKKKNRFLPLSSPSKKKRSVERSTVAKIGFQPARRRYLFVADRSLVFSGARLPTDRAGLSRGIFPPLDHPGGPRGRR